MGAGDFTAETVRVAFFERERGRCFNCRRPLRFEDRGQFWSAHHRKPRGLGGTADPRIGSITNCLILCGTGTTGCHGWVEKHRAIAMDRGLLIGVNAVMATPAGTRVRRKDGSLWLLTESGLAVPAEERDEQ